MVKKDKLLKYCEKQLNQKNRANLWEKMKPKEKKKKKTDSVELISTEDPMARTWRVTELRETWKKDWRVTSRPKVTWKRRKKRRRLAT